MPSDVHKMQRQAVERYCAATIHEELEDLDCAIPLFTNRETYDPPVTSPEFQNMLREFSCVFSTNPGRTSLIEHSIPTNGCHPVRVPPRWIPAHFKIEVERQLNETLQQGIIRPSTNSWLAPAAYVLKRNGEVRIFVDYRELNKRTETSAHSFPLPDEVQDRLAGATIFTKLEFKSGFWQVQLDPADSHKTTFSPGPGMG